MSLEGNKEKYPRVSSPAHVTQLIKSANNIDLTSQLFYLFINLSIFFLFMPQFLLL